MVPVCSYSMLLCSYIVQKLNLAVTTVGFLSVDGKEVRDATVVASEDVGVLQFEVGVISGEPTFDIILEVMTFAGSGTGIYLMYLCMKLAAPFVT